MEPDPDSTLYLFLYILFAISTPFFAALPYILLILILLICSGLISGSEVAFFSLTHNDFEKLELENSSSGRRVLKLKETPRKLLATILISNNFINIAITIISQLALSVLVSPETFEQWAQAIIDLTGTTNLLDATGLGLLLNFLIAVVCVTFAIVLVGEVVPKVYAKSNNIRVAKLMARPLSLLNVIFSPLSKILVHWTRLLEKRLAMSTKTGTSTSKQDIDDAIDLTVKLEKGNSQEIDILKRILKFSDVSAKQIMTSRVDVVAVDHKIEYKDLLRVARDSGYSRIPVYNNDFDNITGILYVKDVLGHLNENGTFEWQKLIRNNLLYVPEAKKINDLLKEFQTQHVHMAIVVDEYGGTSGIVTLEDVMEEIIGEIRDEFDDEEEILYQKVDENTYLFEGKTLLKDLCRILEIDSNTFEKIKGSADSLAGLMLELFGQLPKKESEVTYGTFKFKITSVSNRRVEKVLVALSKIRQ